MGLGNVLWKKYTNGIAAEGIRQGYPCEVVDTKGTPANMRYIIRFTFPGGYTELSSGDGIWYYVRRAGGQPDTLDLADLVRQSLSDVANQSYKPLNNARGGGGFTKASDSARDVVYDLVSSGALSPLPSHEPDKP